MHARSKLHRRLWSLPTSAGMTLALVVILALTACSKSPGNGSVAERARKFVIELVCQVKAKDKSEATLNIVVVGTETSTIAQITQIPSPPPLRRAKLSALSLPPEVKPVPVVRETTKLRLPDTQGEASSYAELELGVKLRAANGTSEQSSCKATTRIRRLADCFRTLRDINGKAIRDRWAQIAFNYVRRDGKWVLESIQPIREHQSLDKGTRVRDIYLIFKSQTGRTRPIIGVTKLRGWDGIADVADGGETLNPNGRATAGMTLRTANGQTVLCTTKALQPPLVNNTR